MQNLCLRSDKMIEENINKLCNAFDFIKIGKTPQDYMYFGIQTNNGWFNLIYKLCEDLPLCGKKAPTFRQGSIHVSDANKEQQDSIRKAEEDSYNICEICGTPGKLLTNDRSWAKTLCEKCGMELVYA